MIDLNYLSEFPKMFSRESTELKYLLNIYNEMKAEIIYIRSTVEIENKSQEGLSKNITSCTKLFTSETSGEDLTNLLKIEQFFTEMCEQTSNEQSNSNAANLVQKAYSLITDDISDFTKGSFENINALVRDLNFARNKYKNFYSKTEKSYKELDQNLISKKKIENDEKNLYNQTLKQKTEDKILNIMNEYEENKQILAQSFDECKRLEVVLNEFIKNILVYCIRFLLNSIKNFKTFLDEICENKKEIFNKIKTQFLTYALQGISETEFELERQEMRYNEMKGIKNDFGYLMTLFIPSGNNSNNYNNENLETSSIDPENSNVNILSAEFNLEEHFNKNNYQNSSFTDNLLSFLFSFLQLISLRKKHLTSFNKFLQDFVKNNENCISLSNKLIKNLSIPKVNVLTNCPFLIQIQEFLRSLFELIIRKEEEYTKFMISSLLTPLEHSLLKDITSDETILNVIFQKLQKEFSNFKMNLSKLLQSKEKVSLNLEKVKESIQKTSDDVNSFSKFEKQFLTLRAEEGNLNEACSDLFRKYKKFLEECLEIIRKTVVSYREKENSKMKEFKDTLCSNIKLKEKHINQITEFLEYSNQISFLNETITKSFKIICNNFSKDFELNITEEIINDFITEIQSESEGECSRKEIQIILNDIIFINKEEIISRKELNLADIMTNQEIESYKEKLNFLKNNARRISIKNVHINRKKYDDIFYIDDDENVLGNFSCALSDKILLQGKLFITNKKLVFYSWFNNSTLFGKTLIEIPKEDIVEVEKHKNLLFDNMILVKTKTVQFLFASLVYRDKCYYIIREVMFGETNPLSVNLGVVNETKVNEVDSNLIGKVTTENAAKENEYNNTNNLSNNLSNNFNIEDMQIEETKSIHGNLEENEEKELESAANIPPQPVAEAEPEQEQEQIIQYDLNTFKGILQKNQFYAKLQNFNKKRLNTFNQHNKRNFFSVIMQDYKLGDMPLSLIFENLFNPDKICTELGQSKNFYITFCESRQDNTFTLTKIEEDTWINKIPKYITNENNYVFSSFKNESNLKDFITNEISNSSDEDYNKIEYKYNYTHPILKKKFMGPNKLEVEDCFKVYFLSPTTLIVEIFSYMSGFMMMDTFYSILQYKFETDYSFDERSSRMTYDTKVTISLAIEFVKDNWFKAKITNEAQSDMDDSIKNYMIPFITKVLTAEREKYLRKYQNFLEGGVEANALLNEPVLENINKIENLLPAVEKIFIVKDLTKEFVFENNYTKEQKQAELNKISIELLGKENVLSEVANTIIKLCKEKQMILVTIIFIAIILLLFIPFSVVVLFLFNLFTIYFMNERFIRIEAKIKCLQEEIRNNK